MKSLFKELDPTKENLKLWAEEVVQDSPTVQIEEWDDDKLVTKDVPNSVSRLLLQVARGFTLEMLVNSGKDELLDECLTYIMEGVGRPYCDYSEDELLTEISGEVFETLCFDTMDEFVEWFAGVD